MSQIIRNGLACFLDVGKEDPIHHYSFRIAQNLLMGYLYCHILITVVYTQRTNNKHSLDFCRPTPDTFHLVVFNSDIGVSGSYQCRVK